MKAKFMATRLNDAALLELVEKVRSMIEELESWGICPGDMYETGTELLQERRMRGI